jgi:PAS domain S-box-containing protein
MHPLIFLLLLAELWLLTVLILISHRLSSRFGLSPLNLVLGMLVAAMQYRALGVFHISFGGYNLTLTQGSFLILPVLMLGLLVIYVVNGTQQARFTLVGMVIINLVIASFQSIPRVDLNIFGANLVTGNNSPQDPFSILVSTVALTVNFVVLIIVYQGVSSIRRRFPSRTAAILALLVAIWCDALIYPLLVYLGEPGWFAAILIHVAGKTLAILALMPMLAYYLSEVVPALPHSAAAFQRPTLDIFTSSQQLEARARYHYSLLRTLSQINQIIVRTENPQSLLDQVCELIVTNRDYLAVWIGILDEEQPGLRISTVAPRDPKDLEALRKMLQERSSGSTPPVTTGSIGETVIVKNKSQNPVFAQWNQVFSDHPCQAMGAFPMRHANRTLGVLNICAHQLDAFDQQESLLLQELADDLAYALISLEARRQQMVLHAASETMLDGLFISDVDGYIIYANPSIANILSLDIKELEGQYLRDILPASENQKSVDEYYQILSNEGNVAFDYKFQRRSGRISYYSVRASLVRETNTLPDYVIVSVRDTTRRRQYEHQLLTLNRLTTDLVQVQSPQELRLKLFQAGEALLQADASAIFLLGPDGRTLSETYTHTISPEYTAQIAKNYQGLPGETAFRTKLPVYVTDVLDDPIYGEKIHFFADYGVRALLILPVLYQENPIGALTLYYQEPHVFVDEDLQLGLTLAQTLAIAIQNTRLYQAEHDQRQFAEALAQAAAALNSSLDLDKVLDHILEQALGVIQCRSANLMLVQGDQACVVRHLDLENIHATKRPVRNICLPLTTPTLQQMIDTGLPLLIPDTVQDPAWRNLSQSSWIRSYAAAPLQIHQEIIGFLNMNSDEANFFNNEIKQRLKAFGDTAAIAIQNARLYQDLQQYSLMLEDRVQERTSELSAAKDRIEHILVSVPDAVFVLDENDCLLQSNPAGENLLVLADQQGIKLFSREFLDQLKAGDLPDEKAILEVQGRAYQALASTLPFKGHQTGLVIVFRDVTRFHELDQMKTRFVSDVSHELRTPLTNLSLYLDLLSTIKDPEKNQSYLETLRRETERLTHLIEDLLTISRIEAGRVEFNKLPLDVNRLVSDLVKDRIPMATGRDLTLTCHTEENLPYSLADPRLLTQVLSNLLTNALNYTPPKGTIQLNTHCEFSDDAKWITISVKDSGVGITPEEISLIFDRFFRGSASQRTGAPGTGLGLAISKEIVERLGGRITVESHPDQGSTFTVWLHAVL